MTSTPPRTPSRSHTPSPSPPLAPHLSLQSPSFSSLQPRATPWRTASQVTLTALPSRLHITAATPTEVSSSASSAVNVDLSEGILVRDADEEADVTENDKLAEGIFVESKEDGEERKKSLRDHLKRTLSRKDANSSPHNRQPREKDTMLDVNEISHPTAYFIECGLELCVKADCPPCVAGERFPQRQYFVFTDAGKPVFVSRPASATEDLTFITGITSALISVFADNTLSPSSTSSSNPDKLRCINAGSTRITFYLRPPLYYVCISKWKEPESVARTHLEYLHLQILSVLTATQLRRIFERRTNFDLRRLLEGTETFLHTLLSRLQSSFAFYTTLSALSSLRLDPSVRTRAGDALVPNSKAGGLDILYSLLISGDDVVTLVRPRKHSVHPTDLHILLNALHTPSVAANPASWLPICLPKFNPQGFVHAYICFLDHEQPEPMLAIPAPGGNGSPETTVDSTAQNSDDSSTTQSDAPSSLVPDVEGHSSGNMITVEADRNLLGQETAFSNASAKQQLNDGKSEAESKGSGRQGPASSRSGLVLVTVSGGGEFDAVRRWSETTAKKLETTGLMSLLRAAVEVAPYGCSELGIPGLRHFLYKSRVHVQATSPIWDEEYQSLENQRRLITLYQTLHDAIHAKSGQESSLKLQYIRTDKEAVLGWITQPFELYVALSPRLPKTAAIGAANAVARWAKREEARLFLRDAPVF